jgi:hypothetical protein
VVERYLSDLSYDPRFAEAIRRAPEMFIGGGLEQLKGLLKAYFSERACK